MAVLTAIATVAAVAGAYSQRKAAKAQAKSYAAQQRQADIANARERRAAVRNARVAQASVESQGAITGVSGSSGIAGSLANIQSRLGENVGFLGQNQQLSSQASQANIAAANWMARANTFNAIGEIAQASAKQFTGPTPSSTITKSKLTK